MVVVGSKPLLEIVTSRTRSECTVGDRTGACTGVCLDGIGAKAVMEDDGIEACCVWEDATGARGAGLDADKLVDVRVI